MKTFWVSLLCIILWVAPITGVASQVMPEPECPMHQTMPSAEQAMSTAGTLTMHDCCDAEMAAGIFHACSGDCEQCQQMSVSVALINVQMSSHRHDVSARLPYLRHFTLVYPQRFNPPPNTNYV
ncbi:MAG: hypothetical protein HLUCCO02_06705 [Idiomarinaceae bacterium HL-53]|nr:MAG: hypothetical protein HLUCCO02_06705 [Idiomarinaceae bacterium HL-53]CUS47343.1 hypothetical protein Ga0003345_0269 [Idiomarinaceae bacterium HL-53]